MKRKPELKTLKAKADVLFSRWVRMRDGNRCVLCGNTHMPQCGHVFTRKNLSTRWDEANSYCQCARCNYMHELAAWPYYKWFIQNFGQERLDELQRQHNTSKQMHRGDYEELIASLEKKIAEFTPDQVRVYGSLADSDKPKG